MDKIKLAMAGLTLAAVAAVGIGLTYAVRREKTSYPVPRWFPGPEEARTAFQDASDALYKRIAAARPEPYKGGF